MVGVEHDRAARLEPEEDLGLRLGDGADRGEELEMRRRDSSDNRDVRTNQLDQRRDLAGVVHADLEYGVLGFARHAGEHQRHTPVIVERLDRPVRRAGRRQHRADRFLRTSLAGAAGDGDNQRLAAGSRGAAERAKRFERIVDDDQPVAAVDAEPVAADDRGGGAGGECRTDEVVPVMLVALNGDEQRVVLDLAAVDGHRMERTVRQSLGPSPRCGDGFGDGPERLHQRPFSVSATTSWSEKWVLVVPTI